MWTEAEEMSKKLMFQKKLRQPEGERNYAEKKGKTKRHDKKKEY